jgi:hypothetical protein
MSLKNLPLATVLQLFDALDGLGMTEADVAEIVQDPTSIPTVVARVLLQQNEEARSLMALFSDQESQEKYLEEFKSGGSAVLFKNLEIRGKYQEPRVTVGKGGVLREVHVSFLNIHFSLNGYNDHKARLQDHVVVEGSRMAGVLAGVDWDRAVLRFVEGNPEDSIRLMTEHDVLRFLSQHPRYLQAMNGDRVPVVELPPGQFSYRHGSGFGPHRVRVFDASSY